MRAPEPVFHGRPALAAVRVVGMALAVLALSGCGSFDRASTGVSGMLTPYKVEVVQGNFVSSEQVAVLRPGLTRNQVREVLGSPLLTSLFHADRWDYVFTIRRQGVEPQARKLALFFKGDELERFEGDTMPSEAEFVSKLSTSRKFGKVPVLEASEADLARFPAAPAAAATADPRTSAAPPMNYPPLEPAAR
jgi:outer membrane protein assembly factor BamE